MPNFVSDFDERLQSRLLKKNQVRREPFDPENREHQLSLKNFISTGNWKDVQFFAEFPYITVPETVTRKMVMYTLKNVN